MKDKKASAPRSAKPPPVFEVVTDAIIIRSDGTATGTEVLINGEPVLAMELEFSALVGGTPPTVRITFPLVKNNRPLVNQIGGIAGLEDRKQKPARMKMERPSTAPAPFLIPWKIKF